MEQIKYTDYVGDKYRYILEADYFIDTTIGIREPVIHPYFEIYPSGHMCISDGYVWDGATGVPSFLQTKKLVVPSLVHDVFCQAVNEGYIPTSRRSEIDKLFYYMLQENNVSKPVAWVMYRFVRRYFQWVKKRGD